MKSISSTIVFLKTKLETTAASESMDWLELQVGKIKADKGSMKLFLSFSQASRHFTKNPLKLTNQDLLEAGEIRTGFSP